MVVGLTPPDTGDVFLEGLNITDLPMYLRARQGLSICHKNPLSFGNYPF